MEPTRPDAELPEEVKELMASESVRKARLAFGALAIGGAAVLCWSWFGALWLDTLYQIFAGALVAVGAIGLFACGSARRELTAYTQRRQPLDDQPLAQRRQAERDAEDDEATL